MKRILLADDHALVRAGIAALLTRAGNFHIVAEAADGRTAVQLTKSHAPDLTLMDVMMPQLNGIEAARQIRKEFPTTRVLMLSAHAQEQYVVDSLRAGASGYLLKDCLVMDLLVAIETVLAGAIYLSPAVAAFDSRSAKHTPRAASPLAKLSRREREVLQLVGEGQSSAQIAALLQLSPRTIETYRENLAAKLHIHSVAGLTRFAIQQGLCSLDQQPPK